MQLVAAWLVFPLTLVLLCAGAGLLVCRLAGLVPAPQSLLPLGYASLVVVSSLVVWIPAVASLATPVAVAAAVAGLAQWLRSRPGFDRGWSWPVAAACAVFLMFGAPVLASGQATFAGYISLDDASTLFAMTDRAVAAGRSVHGLAPSTYEATLATSLTTGYPLGALLPFGIAAKLTGQDLAWVFQPYLAFLAGLLAFGLYGLAGHVTDRRPARAAIASLAAQPALLYGYGLWDGVKELAAAALLVLFAPLAVRCASPRGPWPAAGLVAAALLLALSLGGAIWLAPAAAVAVVLALRRRVGRPLAGACAAAIVFAAPAVAEASTWLGGGHVSSWRDTGRLANLIRPLSPLQVAGIWPVGDFRLRPHELGPTCALVGLVFVLALLGLGTWGARRAWEPLALLSSALVGAGAIWALGSPWVAAKAFATASPAVVLAALAGCAALGRRRHAVEATVAAAAVAGGVLWSNALAFHAVALAPRGQLRELQTIGHRFAGEGPALMTEYQPYGVRHFLRALDPEGASELRRRLVQLRDGRTLGKGAYANLDAFRLDAILVYRTLVLRRSPFESRPPSVYRRVWRGRWYEVWQRPASPGRIVEHVPLGSSTRPGAPVGCATAHRLAAEAPEVAGVPRADPVIVLPLPPAGHPVGLTLGQGGLYSIWVGGSTRVRLAVLVDGRLVGRGGPQLDNDGQLVELARVRIAPGKHVLALRREAAWWRPGEDGPDYGGTGPLVLSLADPPRRVEVVSSDEARRLCGRSLDWIEALR